MQKSARLLGQEYGLTAEEMNRILVKNGFLQGEPGDYTPTPKAEKYVNEQYNHRGNGGYSWYNRYWTTRTFDESIMDEIEITDEVKNAVRTELAAKRAAQAAERKLAEQKATEAFLAAQEKKHLNEELALQDEIRATEFIECLKKAGKGLLIGSAIVAGAYGIYKGVKWIRKRWEDHKKKNVEQEKDDDISSKE